MNQAIEPDSDTIDLSIVTDAIRRHWRTFTACLVGAIVLSLLLFALIPPRWQARATLLVGTITSVAQTDQQSRPIEPLPEVSARMHLAQFQQAVFASPNLAGILAPRDAALYGKTIKAVPVNGTNLIKLNVAGTSADHARKLLEATVTTLIAIHDKDLQAATQAMRARLQDLTQQIAAKQKELAGLQQSLPAHKQAGSRDGYADLLAYDLIARLESGICELTDDQFMLQNLLSPPQTRKTELVDAVEVGDKPYFPNLPMFLLAAIVVGCLVGTMASLYLYKQSRLQA